MDDVPRKPVGRVQRSYAYPGGAHSIDESARDLLAYMTAHLGHADLAGLSVLDVGCGVKFTCAILEYDMPIGRYVGVDVEPKVIEWLRAEIDDPRFAFYLADFANARYNPDGAPMTAESTLPIPAERFDIICLLSVFTHLDPDDYRAMLHILRPYAHRATRLFYTLYIDELTEGGHGLIDGYAQVFGDTVVGQTAKYRDFHHGDVLRCALYTEEYARQLIDGTGWEVVVLSPPVPHAQHHFTLRLA